MNESMLRAIEEAARILSDAFYSEELPTPIGDVEPGSRIEALLKVAAAIVLKTTPIISAEFITITAETKKAAADRFSDVIKPEHQAVVVPVIALLSDLESTQRELLAMMIDAKA